MCCAFCVLFVVVWDRLILPITVRVVSLRLVQSHHFPSAAEATLIDMDERSIKPVKEIWYDLKNYKVKNHGHVPPQWQNMNAMAYQTTTTLVQVNIKEKIYIYRHYWFFARGIHPSPTDSPHKGPVILKTFPCRDVACDGVYCRSFSHDGHSVGTLYMSF